MYWHAKYAKDISKQIYTIYSMYEVLALSHQCECVNANITSIRGEWLSRNRCIKSTRSPKSYQLFVAYFPLLILWIWNMNFQISWYTRISLNHSEKMRMHKIRSQGMCIHWLKIFYPIKLEPIKNYTYIVFFRKWICFYFTIYIEVYHNGSHVFFNSSEFT